MEQLEREGWKLDANAVRELEEDGSRQLRELLLDTDLRRVGLRVLPVHEKTIGRLVLQVASVDDIGETRQSRHGKRLLRLQLTDGYSRLTSVEYRPVPSLSFDVAPGTKVALKGAKVQSGIVLLDDRSIEVLGGCVPLLYEEWQIQRKYSSSSRRASQTSSPGAPVFLGVQAHNDSVAVSLKTGLEAESESSLRSSSAITVAACSEGARVVLESNPEAGPSQNRTAARKLLERKAEVGVQPRRRREGRRHRPNDHVLLTIDEWEAKRSGRSAISDEELARRLQKDLDLEESQPQSEAEQIRMSMFNFSREEPSSRGRGRGRRR